MVLSPDQQFGARFHRIVDDTVHLTLFVGKHEHCDDFAKAVNANPGLPTTLNNVASVSCLDIALKTDVTALGFVSPLSCDAEVQRRVTDVASAHCQQVARQATLPEPPADGDFFSLRRFH